MPSEPIIRVEPVAIFIELEGHEIKLEMPRGLAIIEVAAQGPPGPPSSIDEKVAVAVGATAGYLWGTDGTDGVIRMGPSMSWSRPGNGDFVVLDVAAVDGGTF